MRPVTEENEVVKRALDLLHKNEMEDSTIHNTKAREEIDRYFSDVILPQLSILHKSGRLPNMAEDPLWAQVEEEWNKAGVDSPVACDIDHVRGLMDQFIAKNP